MNIHEYGQNLHGGSGHKLLFSAFLSVLLLLSVVAVGLVAGVSATGPGDTAVQQEEVTTQQTDEVNSLLEYGTNQGNFTTVEGQGVLEAIGDFRNDEITTLELFEVVDFFRSGEKLLDVQFEPQESPGGAAVNVTAASIASADRLDPPDEFVVGIENQSGVIAESAVTGAGTNVTVDGLDLAFDIGERVNLTATLFRADNGSRGEPFLIGAGLQDPAPIQQTAEVNPLQKGLYFIEENLSALDVAVGAGENATVTVVAEAISEVDINGTITLQSDSFATRVRAIGPAGAAGGEFVNESFELPTETLAAGDTLEYDVIVETDGEDIQSSVFGNVVTVQDLSLAEQAVGTSGGSDAILVEGIFAGANQTVEVRNASGGLVGSVELDGNLTGGSVPVPVETTPGEHTARLLTTEGEVVTDDSAVVYGAAVDIEAQAFASPTSEVVVNASDLQPASESDYVVVLHNQTGVPAGGVGPPIGSSGNLTGAQSNVTVSLDAGETLNTTTDVLAMVHFPSATGDFGAPIPAVDGESFGQVTDTATVSVVNQLVEFVDSPAELTRGENASGAVTVAVTADQIGVQNTVETTVELVFEGLPGETETVLGTETVEVAAGATEQVTFDSLAPVPNATTASDSEPTTLRVETSEDNASTGTNVSQSVQSAVDFAGTQGASTVDVLAGTYAESVDVDVAGLTVTGPNAGTDGASDTRGPEAVVTGGLGIAADGVTVDGLQVENADTNGIRFGPDTVPSNVTIQNSVVTNVTGSVGGKGAANGIQFQFGSVVDQTAQNIQILDTEISDISSPDTSGETDAIGVNVLPRGNNVDLEIRGNTFTGIVAGNDTSGSGTATARAISLDTQDDNESGFGRVDGVVITNNTFDGITADDVRAVALFEDGRLDPREGVENFSITRNGFTNLSLTANATQAGPAAVFVGGYETLGTGVVTENNIESGAVFRTSDGLIPGFDPSAAEDLNATGNWWGDETGPSGAGDGVGVPVSENVTFDPWLDAPFPDGNLVSDAGIETTITDSPSTAERPNTVTVTADVTNALNFSSQAAGAPVNITLVFDDGQTTVLDTVNESIVGGETATVTLSGTLPGSTTTERGADYELRVEADVADDSRSGTDSANLTVSNSIQAAVNAASPGGTVDVVPGTYAESVTVDKAVTIEGPNAGVDGANSARGPEAIVTSGLDIAADNVTIDGLQVENTDTNGIRFGPDTVPDNVTIQNSVVTDVTGAVGGKSAGNGIQFQLSNVANETAQNIRILDNEISNITAPTASVETVATGVNVLPRGNNVDLEVDGNTFSEITAGSSGVSAEARGVSLDTQDDNENGFGRVDGAVVSNNTFSAITAPGVVRAVALFEDTSLAPREGPVNVSVTRNNFTALSGATVNTTGAVFVGGYETLGTTVVTENNFESGGVLRFAENQSGFTPANAEELDATRNWWGNRTGPSGAGFGVGQPVSENVTFDPWLNAPFPAGVAVSDDNINQLNFEGDSEVIAGQELAANSTIENNLEVVGPNADPGRPIIVEHVLSTGNEEIVLANRSVNILPDGQENVVFNSPVPERVADTAAEHEIRVRDESRGTSVAVFNGNLTFSDQQLEDDPNAPPEVVVEDVETNVNSTVVVTNESGGDLVIAGLTGVGNNSMTPENVTVTLENESGLSGDHTAHVIRNESLSQAYAPGDVVSPATAEGILDSETALVELQQAEGGNVDFQSQVLGTNNGSPAVLAENVQPVDVVTVDQAFDPQDDFLVLTEGTEVTGPNDVLDFVQLSNVSNVSNGADVALNASGATAGQHTVVLHEPNASGTGPDPSAPRTDASTGEVVNATATVFTGSVNITDQTFQDNTSQVTVDTSDLQAANPAEYVVVIHNQTDPTTGPPPSDVGPALGVSANQTGLQNNVTVNISEITQTTDLLAMIHFPSASDPAGMAIPTLNDTAFGFSDGQAGTVTDTATAEIVTGQVTITDSPATANRGEDLSNDVTANITAQEVTTSTASIEATLVFEGVAGEADTVLGSETVNLGPGDSTTVTFTGLDPIPETATAIDSVPVNLRVETLNGADTNRTDLSNPIQNAIDFADAKNIDTVEVESGTYDESVTVDVPGLTVAGPNAGTPGDSDARDAEAVITGGSGNTPGVQIAADNVTLDGLQVENTDTNGIRFGPDTVPSNVTIQNSVVTNVTGSVGGKGAGNGIQFQFGSPVDQTAQNIQILDNEISNISSPDTSGETDAIGVNVLPRGNNVDLEIRENTFTDIVAGNDTSGSGVATARAISLDTQDDNKSGFGRVDDVVISNNTFDGITADDVRAVALFEDSRLDPREGVENFSITQNRFANLTLTANTTRAGPAAVFVGGYETLGTGVVTENNIESGAVFRTSDSQIPGFDPSAAEDLNAVENWWGNQSGPSGAGPGVGNPVSENVTFDPWLDAPFPAGQPVTDGDIDVRDYVADNETVAGGTLNASATVENGLQGVTTNQGRALTVEHVLLANGNRIVLNSTSVDVVPGTTETVSFVNSSIPDSVSSDSDAEHRIEVRSEFVSQNLVIEPNGSVAFNDQVLGTNASGSDAVLVEDVSTSDDAAVVVTYENNAGDLVIAGLTEIQSNNLGSEDVTVVIEDAGGFPGEHVAHLIPTSDLSTNYSAGDTVSNATASAIVDNDAATVFDGSVNITDQTFEDNTSQVTVDTSDLQAATPAEYVVVIHNQTDPTTGPPPSDVGPALGVSANQTGLQNNVTVNISEITQTTDLLAMIHFPSASDPAGMAIPTLNDTAFGFSDGQAGTVTDTATASIVTGQVAITDSPTTVNRTENLNGQVNATITAQKVTTSNTASIEATLVFEGVTGEGETVLGSETVDLGPGDSTTVTFDNLDPIPNATIASNGSVNLRVDVSQNNNTVSTALSHSVQNAVDFAVADNQSTVDLLAGTFVEEVTIDTDNATIGGTGTGSTTIDGNVTLSGDNNTLEGFTIEGNLTITGANNDISNITVTGQVTQNSVGTTQLPNSGVVIVQNDTTLTDVTSDAIVVQNNSNADVSNSSTETLETETGSNTSISNSNVNTVEGGGDVSSGTDAVEVRDQNGNLNALFDTVQQGVNNAVADGQLVVTDGTYNENVVVASTLAASGDVSGLTITSADGASPEIVFEPSSSTGIPDNVTALGATDAGNLATVEIYEPGVTFEGIDVTRNAASDRTGDGFNTQGITVRDAGVTVQNTTVTSNLGNDPGNNNFGVFVSDEGSPTDNVALDTLTADGFKIGVLISDFYGSSIDGVDMTNIDATTSTDVGLNIAETSRGTGISGITGQDEFESIRTNQNVQTAVDLADTGATVDVNSGTYNGQVTISDDGLTLEGPNAGTPADESRNNEATISGTVEIVGASGVTVDGFKIAEGSSQLTSGVSIQPGSSGANGITVTNSIIENMSAAGGGGTNDFTFGVLSFGGNLSDVTITDNRIANIGNPGVTQGVAVSLQSLTGTTAGTGATVERNTIRNISSLDSTRVGTGVALRSNFNGNDSAAVVAGNSFAGLGIAVSHPQGDTATVNRTDLATVVVDDPGSMNQQRIFTLTVQNAVTAAESGDTVEVGPGTFEESVTIGVEGLTLEGPNAGTPGDSNTRGSEATITQGIEVNASGVTLDGLDVTNSDVNGIVITEAPSDVTVANTVVRDITGGTAGASKGVGNGINLQFNDVFKQTSTGIEVTNNLITGVTTPDPSGNNPDADAIGVQLLPRGNDVVDLRIANNTIENIEPGAASGGRSEARAVSIATQFTDTSGGTRGDLGQATNLTVADNDVSNLTADFARAVNLFEDADGNTTTSDALGPVNFTITRNTVTEINSTSSLPDLVMFVGEYGNFGVDHSVQRNNFLAGVENFGGSSDALNATENWWGNESGPAFDGPGVGPGFVLETGGSVVNFDPWLNAPVPGGQPVTDGDFAVQSFQSDNTSVQRGDTVSASADVTNGLQPVSSNRDAGQVPLEYVLINSSGGVEVIDSKTVEITPGTTDTVTLSGMLSTASTVALDNETLTHRIRIATETSTAADGNIDVSHSINAAISAAGTGDTVTVRAGTYEESVTADVAGLTLEPVASATPTVVGQSSNAVTVGADDVTVSGLDIRNPTGSGDGNTSVNAVGVKVDPANTNVTIENNSIGPVGTAVNTNVIGVYVERDADDVTVTNNTLSMLDGTVDDEGRTQAILLIAQEGGNVGQITGATISDNTITNVTDTRSVKAIELNSNVSGSLTGNDISDLDTDGPAGTGFTQAIALTQGSNANTGPSDVLIENNSISDLEPGTPADFAAPSHIILSAADDVSTIDITDNEFSALADDELFVLDRATGNFDLQGALDANTFTPSAVQVTDGSDRALVPETGVRVVNVDQRTGFDQIQPAVDAANAGDTIDIKSGTYSEEVTVTDSDVAAPAAGSAESTHSWNFTGIDYGQSGNNGDQVDTITVDYPAGTSFDGLNETDITVVMTRTLSDGKDTAEISVNDDQYSGSTATFDLSGFSQTDVAGPIELTIEGIQNPSVGSYDVDVTLNGDAGQKTFTESLSIGSVTLDGSGSSSSGTVLQAPSSGSGNGITANASSLTVRDLRVTDYANGIRLRGTNSGLTFENVASVGNNVRGVEVRNSANLGNLVLDDVNLSNNSGNGIRVATEGIIDGLTIVNSSLNNNRDPNADQFGAAEAIAVFQSEGNPTQLNDVTVSDTEFVDNGGKAIYTEKLSNAVFNNISIDGVLSDVYGFNSGIDINLKYDDYSNITIRDSTVANVSEGNPFNNDPSFSTAIAVKARDDPSSYDTNPATLDDVTIDGVTIEDSFNGLRIGEPGVDYSSAPEGPSNVTITSSTFRNTTGYYVEDVPGDLDLSAVLNGQGNTFDPTAVIVPNENKIVPEENVNILNIDENTGFRSIQAAVDAANAGDTIEVKANTYSESVDITTSGLTLRGVADANGNSPVIEGNGVNTGSQPHAAVHVDDGSGPVRNVTIERFRITNPSGNFGIFAGTGSTNSNNDGIGGLVVQNNVVDNISSQTTGGSLTGGPAGIGIRGDYGTDGNPGIEISNNQISNVQSEGFTNAVGITLKSFTGDAGFGKNSTGADVDDPSSPPATDTDILNNDISNIDGGNDSRTKGISVSGEFEDVLVEGNSISGVIANASGTSGNAFGVTFTENGGSYSGNQYDIDNDGNGERIGPRNFTISGNDIAQITADIPVSIFIGGYEDLNGTDDHVVEGNNLNDTGAAVSRFAGDQPGYQIGDGDTLDVRNNFWGDSTGPGGEDGVSGSGAPAITVGTDSSGNDRSGKVAADESASDPAGYSMTPN